MQLLLLLCFFFIFVLFQYHVYISFLFFLFEASSRKKKCHIVLYECLYFNLFVVCQNEDLKHVAGVVTRKRRRRKKNNFTQNDSLCICVPGEKACLLRGGFLRSERRLQSLKLIKGVFCSLGVHPNLSSLEYFLPLAPMMSLPFLTQWSCSRPGFTYNAEIGLESPRLPPAQSQIYDQYDLPMLQISLVKGMCTSDLWTVTLGENPLPT